MTESKSDFLSLFPIQKLSDQSFKKPTWARKIKDPRSPEKTLWVADPRAIRSLIALMDMHAVLGGAASHYGGPAALADLMSSLHALMFAEAEEKKQKWFDLFNFVNDAGHCENGLYALKALYGMAGLDLRSLRGFRSLESKLTGHGETHCFPEGVLLSNGPLGSAFPQSQGLCLADRRAQNSRLSLCVISDGACMEGEAREALASIPGLAARNLMAPYLLVISDNNTKLTGRIDKDSFSLQPSFDSLPSLGWELVLLEDPHDSQKAADALWKAMTLARENPLKPVALRAKTIKGYGHKKSLESSSGGHGFSLKSSMELLPMIEEIYGGRREEIPQELFSWVEDLVSLEKDIDERRREEESRASRSSPTEKIQKGVAAALIRARKEGLPVVSITSDLPGSTGVADFRKEFPQDSWDVGVAESNMISVAAGFSKAGFLPVVDTFAQFGVTKGALPLTMASLSQAPVMAFFSHTGFQDAADGASHQALSYLAMVGSIPHVRTLALSCSDEAGALVYAALREQAEKKSKGEVPETFVFFLGRENFPRSFGASNYSLNEAQVLRAFESQGSKKVVLVTWGSLVSQALEAGERAKAFGIDVCVINHSCLNYLDQKLLIPLLEEAQGRLVTLEDHQILFGFSAFLSQQLALNGVKFHLKARAVCGEFGQSAYNAIDLYKKHRIDEEAALQSLKSFF